uniref:Ras-related protein Rab-3 n=1 Tax=Heterorhabditis bacteriophora TaxID=37862 RepID=A0A1I7WE39_HETBA
MAVAGGQQPTQGDQNFDYMFKLLIIGNSSVGKTSFLFRYCDDSFTSAFVSTVGIDFKVKTVFRGDKRVKLQIWIAIYYYLNNYNYLKNGHIILLPVIVGLEFFETSAKENINVKAVFEKLVEIICDKMAESLDKDPQQQPKGQRLDATTTQKPATQQCNC